VEFETWHTRGFVRLCLVFEEKEGLCFNERNLIKNVAK